MTPKLSTVYKILVDLRERVRELEELLSAVEGIVRRPIKLPKEVPPGQATIVKKR